MTLKKKDFIEIEFTGKTDEGEIFDSNIKEDLKKIGSEIKPKPFVFALGEDMFMKGIDDFLIGKNIGEHKIKLEPENAFGKREPKLIQMIPMKNFSEQKLNPVPGAVFNFDGKIAKILNVSGGRVLADFNNPLAGKTVNYDIKILRKVEDINEKAKALIDFLFRRELEFEIKNKQLLIKVEKQMKNFVELFRDKFLDLLGLEMEVREFEKSEEKQNKKTESPEEK